MLYRQRIRDSGAIWATKREKCVRTTNRKLHFQRFSSRAFWLQKEALEGTATWLNLPVVKCVFIRSKRIGSGFKGAISTVA